MEKNQRALRIALWGVLCIALASIFINLFLWKKQDNYKAMSSGRIALYESRSNPSPTSTVFSWQPQELLSAASIIDLTNTVRSENGQTPLKHNHLLDMIAEARVRDMFSKQYFNHISPTGEGPAEIAVKMGYSYKRIAENIASGVFITNRKIIDSWMQSPGHQRNILSGETDEIGVSLDQGILHGNNVVLAVQIFGKQSSPVVATSVSVSCMEPESELLRQIEKERGEIIDLNRVVTSIRKELSADQQELELLQQDTRRKSETIVGIVNYNAKAQKLNELIGQVIARQELLQKTIDQYNAKVKEYRSCLSKR